MDSINSTPSRRHHRERLRLVSQVVLITGDVHGKMSVAFKISNEEVNVVDDNSIALLAMPDGVCISQDEIKPSFHSFVITVENGQRIFGSSFMFGHKVVTFESDESTSKSQSSHVYTSRSLVALTIRPIVTQMKLLLEWCVFQGDCNPRWLRCVSQFRLPSKGKCIKVNLPTLRKYKPDSPTNVDFNNLSFSSITLSSQQIVIFRPLSTLPFFDYPLRQLFLEVLSPEQFLIALTCALLECQILITSCDNFKLMLVAESLTSLLNPFKWQHVYVPILPSKLGLHYLEAPTPYVFGVNVKALTQHTQSTSLTAQCKIDCDSNQVEFTMEGLEHLTPPFIDDIRNELEAFLSSDLRLTSLVTPKSDAYKRVTEIAKKHKVIDDELDYLDDLKLNQAIRLIFLKAIKKNLLTNHQQYIVVSNNKRETIKFDSVSYMSDQPASIQPFLVQFLETQMFATFIDETAKQMMKTKTNRMQSSMHSLILNLEDDEDNELDDLFNDAILESRFKCAQEIDLIDLEEPLPTLAPPRVDTKLKTLPSPAASPRLRRKNLSTLNLRNGKDQSSLLQSPQKVPAAITAQTNWKVVETLLREVKMKTKRILLEKMGSDEVGHLGCGSVGGVEENTLIAALCDLIERIWTHARADIDEVARLNTQKCAFWSHLMAFDRLENSDMRYDCDGDKDNFDSSMLTPALSQMSLSEGSNNNMSNAIPASPSRQLNNNHIKPVPTTLIHDLRSIRAMSDIKTDVGKSRAFIRLALERKLLSKHLRTLISNQELLLTLYKRYAFLRCEEEREQFLTHLLTLNAVDLMCFTNTFTTSNLPYTLIIYGSGQFSGWFSLSGSVASTSDIHITNPCSVHAFNHRNLGVLTTLTICLNQSSKLFIEYCFIRNEITGHIFKFYCNRWFGRSIDDGATERVLLAEMISSTSVNDVLKKCNSRSSSIGRNWSRSNDHAREELSIEELQALLGENVNQIMKHYFSHHEDSIEAQVKKKFSSSSKLISNSNKHFSTLSRNANGNNYHQNRNLLNLIFAEKKFLWILLQVFYYGFKNRGRSSFRKQTFLWDYLLRIQCELKIGLKCNSLNPSADNQVMICKFNDLIDRISEKASCYGKDGKFQLFILLSLRDHLLCPHFLTLMTKPSLSQYYYESKSFIRDQTMSGFLNQLLTTFNDIHLSFESSLTKDL